MGIEVLHAVSDRLDQQLSVRNILLVSTAHSDFKRAALYGGVKLVLDTGMWAGMTLYPETKCSPARAIDILETYGDSDPVGIENAESGSDPKVAGQAEAGLPGTARAR